MPGSVPAREFDEVRSAMFGAENEVPKFDRKVVPVQNQITGSQPKIFPFARDMSVILQHGHPPGSVRINHPLLDHIIARGSRTGQWPFEDLKGVCDSIESSYMSRRDHLLDIPGSSLHNDRFHSEVAVGTWSILKQAYIYLGLILSRVRRNDVRLGWDFLFQEPHESLNGARLYSMNRNPITDFYAINRMFGSEPRMTINDAINVVSGLDFLHTDVWAQLQTSYQRWYWFFHAEELLKLQSEGRALRSVEGELKPNVEVLNPELTQKGRIVDSLFRIYFGDIGTITKI